ncbi:hypothetical protein [Sphingomonas yantingensis]|uniref:Uncharacterized protein n=1 Tax=Sphingomonas yantingensis TaxID=1241761 RepID=A0A7W9EIF2_9SPHN|nr:hypothetical protein [Sphingomonas yantingensis]MBB5697561.1 hypothetical protein [Sphingomonas yantingensis]
MTLARALLIGAFLTTAGWGQSSIAQKRKAAPSIVAPPPPSCPPDTDRYADWLAKSARATKDVGTAVPDDAVHEVRQDRLRQAIALADTAEIVPLSDREVDELLQNTPAIDRRNGRPFLMRNVVPALPSKLELEIVSVRLVGSRLWISGGVIGCDEFRKAPVVIYLPTSPTGVDIMASEIF